MRGERRLLRIGEYLIGRAARLLPAEMRDERRREWAAELPAILRDPDTRLAAHRAARMLGYVAGTLWGTALAAGGARGRLTRWPGSPDPAHIRPSWARSCGKYCQGQSLRKSGWPSCHHTSTTLPTMLEPLTGPQYRLSHEIARLSPSR